MNDYFSEMPGILSLFWGQTHYQLLFIISLVIIFVFEKNSIKRNVFLWYPLITYLLLISPLHFFIGERIYQLWKWPYYCRQFSIVPIFYVIAYACVLICNKFDKFKKFTVFLFCCVLIVLCGSEFIYANDDMIYFKSENAYKISNDLITVCDYMDQEDEDPVISLHADLAYQARQYDASLHMLVGMRDESKLSEELGSDTPDVQYIMQTSCENGADYVLAYNKDSIEVAFSNGGFKPCLKTDSILLYKCGGYDYIKKEYDDKDKLVRIRYYNANGDVRITDEGYASRTFVYDNRGNAIEEYYFDENDRPMSTNSGIYGILMEYNVKKFLKKTTCVDENKNPIINTSGYCIAEYETDMSGRVTKVNYYDDNNLPVLVGNSYHYITYEYSAPTVLSKATYYDISGNIVSEKTFSE